MTMQVHEHPKPKMFGKGYGAHIAYHFRMFKKLVGALIIERSKNRELEIKLRTMKSEYIKKAEIVAELKT